MAELKRQRSFDSELTETKQVSVLLFSIRQECACRPWKSVGWGPWPPQPTPPLFRRLCGGYVSTVSSHNQYRQVWLDILSYTIIPFSHITCRIADSLGTRGPCGIQGKWQIFVACPSPLLKHPALSFIPHCIYRGPNLSLILVYVHRYYTSITGFVDDVCNLIMYEGDSAILY